MNEFESRLVKSVVGSLNNNFTIHEDSAFDTHPYKEKTELPVGNYKDKLINRLTGKYYVPKWTVEFAIGKIFKQKNKLAYFEFCYNKLKDDKSRSILIELVTLRICGASKVKLSIENATYSDYHIRVNELEDTSMFLQTNFRNWKLNLFDLKPIDYELKLYCRSFAVATFFLQEQYANRANNVFVEKNDIVIDAGGCWGDTALYFSSLAEKGKVYSFEFIQSNIDIFNKNLDLNPDANIEIVPNPLWSEANKDFYYKDDGPASQVFDEKKEGATSVVKSQSIDNFAIEQKLESIDFIKMDIEGAELQALKGAEQSIIKFKPKLAIALYHYAVDFLEIPSFIDELNLGYEFYLGHATPSLNETILFAKVKNE